MIKTAALVLLMITFVSIGQYFNGKLKRHVDSLRLCIVMIEAINAEISYSCKTITEILKCLSQREDLKKLCFLTDFSVKNDADFPNLWKKAVINKSQSNSLDKDDVKLLLSFGASLGITDSEGQKNNCILHIKMFEKQLEKAEKILNEKTKVNTALSILLGTVTVVLLY